jgi:hypothetical protein
MNDTYQAMLESSRTQFYLGNGWRSPIIAEMVGRLEDGETVSLEDYERIDCLIEDMQTALRAALAKQNGPGMPHHHFNMLIARLLWRYWVWQHRRWYPLSCGYYCDWVYPYGFVPEADCPVHDR